MCLLVNKAAYSFNFLSIYIFIQLCFWVKFMFCWFCSLNTVILCATDAWLIVCTNKIYTYGLKKSYFICPITKGSVNALMRLRTTGLYFSSDYAEVYNKPFSMESCRMLYVEPIILQQEQMKFTINF